MNIDTFIDTLRELRRNWGPDQEVTVDNNPVTGLEALNASPGYTVEGKALPRRAVIEIYAPETPGQ